MTPTPKSFRNLASVMEAHERNPKLVVEARYDANQPWSVIENPTWSSCYEWRIKPCPKLREWTREEVPVGAIIVGKETGYHYLITGANGTCVFFSNGTGSFAYVLENFTLANGQPCGVEVAE